MQNTLVLPTNPEELASLSDMVWNFQNNLCLFPIYLFNHFHHKYCGQNKIVKEHVIFGGKDSVCSKCAASSLPDKYSSWFCVNNYYDHVKFSYEIGTKEFTPFSETSLQDRKAEIWFQVFHTKITTNVILHSGSYQLLSVCNTVTSEIAQEMKKHSIIFPENY